MRARGRERDSAFARSTIDKSNSVRVSFPLIRFSFTQLLAHVNAVRHETRTHFRGLALHYACSPDVAANNTCIPALQQVQSQMKTSLSPCPHSNTNQHTQQTITTHDAMK